MKIYSEEQLDLLDEHDSGVHATPSIGCPACEGWVSEKD